MESDEIMLDQSIFSKWIKHGMAEIIKRFDLQLPSGMPDYPHYYFMKKNPNRYFKKHLGFTYSYISNSERKGTITVNDHKKLMVFRLKYDI
jgi:hypothetical protein